MSTKSPYLSCWSNQVLAGDIIVCGERDEFKFPVVRIEKGWVAERFIVLVDGVEQPHDVGLQVFGTYKVLRDACQVCFRQGAPLIDGECPDCCH